MKAFTLSSVSSRGEAPHGSQGFKQTTMENRVTLEILTKGKPCRKNSQSCTPQPKQHE